MNTASTQAQATTVELAMRRKAPAAENRAGLETFNSSGHMDFIFGS
jgi:hypothetical protein